MTKIIYFSRFYFETHNKNDSFYRIKESLKATRKQRQKTKLNKKKNNNTEGEFEQKIQD